MEDTVVPLERNLHGHPLAGLLWDRQFEKVPVEHGWEKVPKSECPHAVFLSVHVGDTKLAGKKGTVDLAWKVFMKHVDKGDLTSFLDHVYLGCTQRECKTSEDIVENYMNLFESRISVEATGKLPDARPHVKTIS